MAFNINEGRQQFTASSSQTIFNFNFCIFTDTDLKVYKTPVGQTPDDTADLLTIGTNYSVSINGTSGGTVTLTSGATLNDIITIVRDLPITRTTDYQSNGDLFADTLDSDQDYQTYLIQDRQNDLSRAVLLPDTILPGVSVTIPNPIADAYFKWNSTANAIENDTTIPTNVTLSEQYKDEAKVFRDEAEAFSLSKAFVIDTIEDLITIPSSYTTAIVKDLNRGGTFIWSPTGTANGGTVFAGATGYWTRQYDGAVNVKWFGAVGDGITDDTVAIQSAINSSDSVYIPSCINGFAVFSNITFTSSAEIPKNLTIFGDGKLSKIKLISSGLIFNKTNYNTKLDIKMLNFEAGGVSSKVVFNVAGGNVDNNIFNNFTLALEVNQAYQNITKNTFIGCTTSIKCLDNNIVTTNYYNASSIADNVFIGATTAVELRHTNPAAGVSSATLTSISMLSNTFETCTTCYSIAHMSNSYIGTTYIEPDCTTAFNISNFTKNLIIANTTCTNSSIIVDDSSVNILSGKFGGAINLTNSSTIEVTSSSYTTFGAITKDGTSKFLTLYNNGDNIVLANDKYIKSSMTTGVAAYFNSYTSGKVVEVQRAGVATIGLYVTSTGGAIARDGNSGIFFNSTGILPSDGSGNVVDNTKTFGSSSFRWSTIYAGTGTINTSDAREKTFLDIEEVELQVAKELKALVKKFKFNDAIEAKGVGNARIHYGTSAQEVIEVFKKYGLDAMQYAMVCYDEWDEEQEIVDEDGSVTQAYRPAGSRYGIRYEELIMFILGAM